MRRPCNNNRERILVQSQLRLICFQIFRSYRRIGLIKFCITCHKDFFRICAKMSNIISINTGLHAETAHGSQHVSPDTEQIMICLDRSFGNTAVDHHHRNVPLPDSLQEVGPQFRLDRQENTRLHTAHNGFRHPRQIQREINVTVCFRDNLFCHIVATHGKSRYQHFPLRHHFFDFFYNRTGRYNFTYRCAMDPDAIGIHHISNLFPADQADTLPKPSDRSLFLKQAINKKGQSHDEKYKQD